MESYTGLIQTVDKLEKEVEAADWKNVGRTLTNGIFYTPPEKEESDPGGWQGGSFTLDGGGITKGSHTGEVKSVDTELSRRETMARAAEERMKKLVGTKV